MPRHMISSPLHLVVMLAGMIEVMAADDVDALIALFLGCQLQQTGDQSHAHELGIPTL